MRRTRRPAFFGCIAMVLVLAGCNATVQTTSGKDYLSTFPASASKPQNDIDERLREVANLEPLLRFPARIGLARIGRENGRLTLIPPPIEEAKAWLDLADNLGPDYGELVPIGPLIAAIVAPVRPNYYERSDMIRATIDTVRLAAARQHIDAVLIYEVDATAISKSNPLSIADWIVIGAFVLPSQDVKAEGVTQAILLDVRNGYPYATIQATADDKAVAARFANHEAERDLSKRVQTAAVQNLTHEARGLIRQLKVKLAAVDLPARK